MVLAGLDTALLEAAVAELVAVAGPEVGVELAAVVVEAPEDDALF